MKLSLVVIAYNMARELPRTLLSLSPAMQRDCTAGDYELIVVDNGSAQAVEPPPTAAGVRLVRIEPAVAAASPVQALQLGLDCARGDLVGVLIDGARLASPGLVASALRAQRLSPRAVILTLGFHLGSKVQMQSVHEGYDQAAEDRLLAAARWWEDGYRLFDISVLAGSSSRGWFHPINESNAIFMPRALWSELGGCDPRFVSPGGGYANLDLLKRAVALDGATVVTLLGEGTFHQVHGGVATNALQGPHAAFEAEYLAIRGEPYRPAFYDSLYLGGFSGPARRTLGAGG